jgi:hypothetical protein
MPEVRAYGIFNLTTGTLMLFINLYWIIHNVRLYWLYHYTTVLFAFMHLDWMLVAHVLGGIAGVFIAISVIEDRISSMYGLLCQSVIIACWVAIEFLWSDIYIWLNQ